MRLIIAVLTALVSLLYKTQLVVALSRNGTQVLNVGVLLPASVIPEWTTGIKSVLRVYAEYDLMMRPQLIDNNTRIQFYYGDTQASDAVTVSEAFSLQGQGIVALVGAGFSGNSAAASLVLQGYNIPMCCGSSTSPSLSDKSEYPNFFRMVPNDNLQGTTLCKYIKYQGWRKFAILNVLDNYGSGLNSVITDCARSQGLTVLSQQTYYSGDTNFTTQLLNLRDSEARIIVYFGYSTELPLIGKQARDLGVWTSQHAWLSADGAYELFSDTSAQTLDQRVQAEGLTMVIARQGHGPLADNFTTLWNTHATEFISQQDFANGMGQYSMFMVNCLETLVLGLDRVLNSNNSFTTEDLIQRRLNSLIQVPDTFRFPDRDSVTGDVILDDNGDRAGSYILYNAYQGVLHNVGEYVDGVFTMTDSVKYDASGSTEKPSDTLDIQLLAVYVSLQSGASIGFIVIAAIGLVSVLFSGVMIAIHRQKRIVRNASPIMSLLILVGISLGFTQVFVMIGQPTDLTCHADIWIIPLSFAIIFGSLIAKTLRIYRIFTGVHLQLKGTKDKDTVAISMLFVVVEIVLLAAWSGTSRPTAFVLEYVPGQYQWTCTSPNQSIFTTLLIVYNALMLCLGLALAFLTRGVSGQFRETNRIGASIYSIVLCTLLGLPIAMTETLDYQVKFTVKLTALYFSLFFLLVALFAVQIWKAMYANGDGTSASEQSQLANKSKSKNTMMDSLRQRNVENGERRYPAWQKESSVLVQRQNGVLSSMMPSPFKRCTALLDQKLGILIVTEELTYNLDKAPESTGLAQLYFVAQSKCTFSEKCIVLRFSSASVTLLFDDEALAKEWYEIMMKQRGNTTVNSLTSGNGMAAPVTRQNGTVTDTILGPTKSSAAL